MKIRVRAVYIRVLIAMHLVFAAVVSFAFSMYSTSIDRRVRRRWCSHRPISDQHVALVRLVTSAAPAQSAVERQLPHLPADLADTVVLRLRERGAGGAADEVGERAGALPRRRLSAVRQRLAAVVA